MNLPTELIEILTKGLDNIDVTWRLNLEWSTTTPFPVVQRLELETTRGGAHRFLLTAMTWPRVTLVNVHAEVTGAKPRHEHLTHDSSSARVLNDLAIAWLSDVQTYVEAAQEAAIIEDALSA